jgi:MoaA/NifB/PqqE/SkfB family radical SAM enzyme
MALGTNGYLLNDDHLDMILPALTYLRFNISAGKASRYAEIMGCKEGCFSKVIHTVKKCVEIKKKNNLSVTIGLQMVLLPEFQDQILPLAKLGKSLQVDYLVIKHCSDDENGKLGIDYSKYYELVDILQETETYSDKQYHVKVKWSKILSRGKRKYNRCYGPPFMVQFSGSGLVAPCGMLFNSRYKDFHIGNIAEASFKAIWKSDRYWEVMAMIASDRFNPQIHCGTLCLQHKVNEYLYDLMYGDTGLKEGEGEPPMHVNFI